MARYATKIQNFVKKFWRTIMETLIKRTAAAKGGKPSATAVLLFLQAKFSVEHYNNFQLTEI